MSGKKLIGLGDKTTTGGVVLSAHLDVQINNQGTATEKCLASCGLCGQTGMIKVIEKVGYIISDLQVAREQDIVLCHCPEGTNRLIGSPGSAIIGGTEDSVEIFMPLSNEQAMNAAYNAMNDGLNSREVDINDIFSKISGATAAATKDEWLPVNADFPVLIYQTERKMNDENAPDMLYKDESREKIESYGFGSPFKQEVYTSSREGFTLSGEDQFALPISAHIERMRGLGALFSRSGKSAGVFYELVNQFEKNQGGHYSSPLLNELLKYHNSTAKFNNVLCKFVSNYLIENEYKISENILSESSSYMNGDNGVSLPKFNIASDDLFNGGVLTVHDIWSMNVYADKLEYKENKIRGVFRYEIQDHFGLNTADIDHKELSDLLKKFELSSGFRSWYLLQHYIGYGLKPIFTDIKFSMDIK